MRYHATSVSATHTVELSWGDFDRFSRKCVDLTDNLLRFGSLVSKLILNQNGPDVSKRGVDWALISKPGDLDNAMTAINVAYFMSYDSKYADYHDWTQVRLWFKRQEPAVQSALVRARIWFTSAVRSSRTRTHNVDSTTIILSDESSFGSFVWADLSTGAVVMAMHVDHSDC